MLDLIINEALTSIAEHFLKFGIKFDVKFSTKQFSDNADQFYSSKEFNKSINELKNDHSLLLYNYSPMRAVNTIGRNNNITTFSDFDKLSRKRDVPPESYYNKKTHYVDDWKKEAPVERRMLPTYDEFSAQITKAQYNDIKKEVIKNLDPISVRESVNFAIDLNFFFMSTQTEVINVVQFLLIKDFVKSIHRFSLSFEFRDGLKESLDYFMTFNEEIRSTGHVDYDNLGNLQRIEFGAELTGTMLSPFVDEATLIEIISTVIGVRYRTLEEVLRR